MNHNHSIHLIPIAAVLCLALPIASSAETSSSDGPQATITSWEVPWENTRPRDPFVDQDGSVWFVGQRGNYLAKLDPESGEFTHHELPEGTGPHNLIVAEDGGIWYAGNHAAHIGRLDPQTGQIRKFTMPDPGARDPHTLVFDQDGNIWFTVQHGNMIGKLDTRSGQVELVDVVTPRARPYGVVIDPYNQPWIVLFGTNKLATVEKGVLGDNIADTAREFSLPREEARPRRLDVSSDGRVWYVDYAGGHLGVFDQRNGRFQEWLSPSGADSQPYAMAVVEAERGSPQVWYVESGPSPHLLIGFDPETETFFSQTPIENSTGSTRHMMAHEGTLWFGLDSNYITRAVLP